jgi:DNA-binding IclR family transcriptional regulator
LLSDSTSTFTPPARAEATDASAPVKASRQIDDEVDYAPSGLDAFKREAAEPGNLPDPGLRASQTLQRGLDILDLVAQRGPMGLRDIGQALDLSRSTTSRLAAALAERDLLHSGANGYALGAKLLALAEVARLQRSLTAVARPHLEHLAREQQDAVNLAISDGGRVRYLDQARGSRRMHVRSVIGETRALASTALGRALLLDAPESAWRKAYEDAPDTARGAGGLRAWEARMRQYRHQGAAFDVEENDDGVRCVAAPVRDASGRIIAAISLSSLPHYLDDARMQAVTLTVRATAEAIARDLGWRPGR